MNMSLFRRRRRKRPREVKEDELDDEDEISFAKLTPTDQQLRLQGIAFRRRRHRRCRRTKVFH